MSTEIKSVRSDRMATVARANDQVEVDIRDDHRALMGSIGVSRADFLAAVAKECGVIVIDRAEMPETVTWEPSGDLTVGIWTRPPEWWLEPQNLAFARAILAAQEHASHPPVDEAQVEALAADLGRVDAPGSYAEGYHRDMARRLVREGWRR